MDGALDVVRGRRIERVPAAAVIRWIRGFERTVLDLGTGDGRWAYRRARADVRTAFIGIDANARLMREVSFRAGRKPARGGVANLFFIRASVEALPQALTGVADEIYVLYPWGSLLETVWTPRPDGLRAIAGLARSAGRLEVHVNASAVGDLRQSETLATGYGAAGVHLDGVTFDAGAARTSWGGRIAHGREPRIIVLKGTISGDSCGHPQR